MPFTDVLVTQIFIVVKWQCFQKILLSNLVSVKQWYLACPWCPEHKSSVETGGCDIICDKEEWVGQGVWVHTGYNFDFQNKTLCVIYFTQFLLPLFPFQLSLLFNSYYSSQPQAKWHKEWFLGGRHSLSSLDCPIAPLNFVTWIPRTPHPYNSRWWPWNDK